MKVPTKTVGKPKPVEEVDLTATTEEDEVVKGNSDFVNTGAIVNNAKKRKCKPTVVVSDSVVMQPLVPQVHALGTTYETPAEAVKSRKRKVGVVSAKASEVVQSRKHMQGIVVSNPVSLTKTDTVDTISETPTELNKNRKRTKSVSVPHATTPVVMPILEVVTNNAIPVVGRKSRKRKVAEPIVVKNEAVRTPLMVSGQIGDVQQPKCPKPTLVPSAIIPSSSKQIVHSESDGDSQMEAEEAAYCKELAKKQNALGEQRRVKPKRESAVSGVVMLKPKRESAVSGVVMPQSSTGSQAGDENELICCSKCKKVFQDVDELELHEKKCFLGRRYPCKYPGCGHVNSQKSLLNEHIKGVHENNPFRCEVCSETFIYWKSLRKHEKRAHAEPDSMHMFKYNCSECDFVSDDKTEFQMHTDRHMNMKRYKCNVCAMAFFTQSQLTNHLKHSCSALIVYKFECSVCGKKLKSEDRYREHFYSQHVLNQPEKMYYCEVCISRFFSERGLKIHGCIDAKK